MSIAEELVERNEENFSRAAITLLKGLVSRGRDESLWQVIVNERAALGDYFQRLGLVLNFADIMRRMEPFLPVPANEMKYRQTIEHIISQVMQLGFLQRMKGSEDEYEVRPVLRRFVDAQWLSDFADRLAEYEEHGQKLHTGSTAEQTVEPSGEEGLLSGFVQHE